MWMSDQLILHYAPDNASLCVRLALEELGIDYVTALVDRSVKAQRSPAYLAINPNGLIPTLQTPQGPIYETGAILLWLAENRPSALFPQIGDPKRAAALTRLFWLSNTLHPALRMLFYPDFYAPNASGELRHQTRIRLCALYDQMAADHAHLVATEPNLIACYLAPLLRWSAIYGGQTDWFTLGRWPALLQFAETFETRPAALRAAQAEGLGPTPFSNPTFPNPPEGSAT